MIASNWIKAAKLHYSGWSEPKKSFFTNGHQTIFVIFIVLLAIFARNNPYLQYPQTIYLFAAFLISSVFTNYSLDRMRIRYWAVDLLVFWNCLVISAMIQYSGSTHSYMWVLYLLPIFTSAILLHRWQLIFTAACGIVMMSYFYGNPFTEWDRDVIFEMAGKGTVLFMGAVLMNSLVAERDKVEVELSEERDKLEEMTRSTAQTTMQMMQNTNMAEMGKNTSGIIHDLGTPVSVILGSARMMDMEKKAPSEDLQRIIDAALLCKNILSNAMNMAKGQEFKIEPINVLDTVDSALAIAHPLLLEKNLTVVKNIKDRPPLIKGSYAHVQRVFLNLVLNAKGALKPGGKIFINMQTSPDRQWVLTSVEDNGTGFPPLLLQNGPQAFQTTKKEGEGTGLGLVTTKQLVEKQGGAITFSNRLQGGARVLVKLPVAPEKPAPAAPKAA